MLKLLLFSCFFVLTHCGKLRFEPFSPDYKENSIEHIKCTDHVICQAGYTCCEMPDGEIGCCPFPQAVCCSDHIHCCPRRHKCVVSTGRCVPTSGKSIAWSEKIAAITLLDHSSPTVQHEKEDINLSLKSKNVSLTSVLCPGGKARCPDGNTCCQSKNNGWGCCPSKEGVCCKDHVNCCPHGYTCNEKHGTCKPKEDNISDKNLLKLSISKNVDDEKEFFCPDNVSSCPTGTTCCLMQSGWYGCCPMENAICCASKLMCCTQNQICDNEKMLCMDKDDSTPIINIERETPDKIIKPWFKKKPAMPREEQIINPWFKKQPAMPQEDLIIIPWFKKQPAIPREKTITEDIACPDNQTSCRKHETCCKLKSGQYGCCPMRNAVCCADQLHCCPQYTKCDVLHSSCTSDSSSLKQSPTELEIKKTTFLKSMDSIKRVECPDNSTCSDSSTCCEFSTGIFGCCPFKDAICCSDHVHCCPSGTKCNVKTASCDADDISLSQSYVEINFNKYSGSHKIVQTNVLKYTCPDEKTSCPSGSTCCQLISGEYGCCPLPNAVCCSDGIHCCPNGYLCDDSSGACFKSRSSVRLLSETPSYNSVLCPDGASSCPSGSTCCKLNSGEFGCCPLPKAVCCSDGIHCCPNGYSCDDSSGACFKSRLSIRLLSETAVLCPDGVTSCPSWNTCCKLYSGEFGCCPLPRAVCCSDGYHCCPNGYSCDDSSGACFKSRSSVRLLSETPSSYNSTVCPDGVSSCPSGNTCCKLNSGEFGCCPLPDAVCCSDHIHCCPNGYTCDVSAGTCLKSKSVVQLLSVNSSHKKSIECPGTNVNCSDGQTCCLSSTGKYQCCPFENGICCADHLHCCPQDSSCDEYEKECIPNFNRTTHFNELVKSVKFVKCDDDVSCKDGDTCCKLADGKYACCDYPDAVCCEDKIHCCPAGSKCDISKGICLNTYGYRYVPMSKKSPPIRHNDISINAKDIICPDKKSECLSGSTCCLLKSGEYGCCPFPEATCCDDRTHCCPNGYGCNAATGMCERSQIDSFPQSALKLN